MNTRASSSARAWEGSLEAITNLFYIKQRQRIQLPQHERSYPNANSARAKPRRWPLVLRFHKGSIHSAILLPVLFHAAVAAGVVCLQKYTDYQLGMPDAIIPCLSIVVGLMLVFRNTTAYTRFLDGRDQLNIVTTSVRCLSRAFFACVPAADSGPRTLSSIEREKILQANRILIACMISMKNHLRTQWGRELSCDTIIDPENGICQVVESQEYDGLLPPNLKAYEYRGLGLTLELVVFIERFVKEGSRRGWFDNATASGMTTQLNNLVHAYGTMEVIRLMPMPVTHLIHSKQTLALFCTLLPFAVVVEMGWLSVLLVGVVSFTLYGIEGIASKFEDPFAGEKLLINIDGIVKDATKEIETLMVLWERGGRIFEPRPFANVQRSRQASDDSWNTAYDTVFNSRRNTRADTLASSPTATNNNTRTNTSSRSPDKLENKSRSPNGRRNISHGSTASITIPVASADAKAKTKDMKEMKAAQKAAEREQTVERGEEIMSSSPDMSGVRKSVRRNCTPDTSPKIVNRIVSATTIRGRRGESSRTSLCNTAAATAATTAAGSPTPSIPPYMSPTLPSPIERLIAETDGARDDARAPESAASIISAISGNEVDSSVSTGEPPAGVTIPPQYRGATAATTSAAPRRISLGTVGPKPFSWWKPADGEEVL